MTETTDPQGYGSGDAPPANTPSSSEPDFAELGPATRLAIRTGLRACDQEIVKLEDREKFRALTPAEAFDLREWKEARTKLLTQPYPLPYVQGRDTGAEDRGSQPAESKPPS